MNTDKVPSLADCVRIQEAAEQALRLLSHKGGDGAGQAHFILHAALNPAPPPAEPVPTAEISVALAEFQASAAKRWPGEYSFVRRHGVYLDWKTQNLWMGWVLAKGLL